MNNIMSYLLFLVPLLLKYIFIFVFGDYELLFLRDFLEDFVFYIFICLAINILKGKLFKLFLIVVYVFYFFLEGASYLAVSSNFSSSFMYVLVESSKGEFSEFMHSYFSGYVIFFLILMVCAGILLAKKEYKSIDSIRATFLILCLIVFLKLTGLIESNAYHNAVRGVYGYYQLQKGFRLKQVVENEDVSNVGNNDVLVIVLGESTNREHMQLYGYNRETTPLLGNFKDSLLVYNDIISTDVLTVKALPKMLLSSSSNHNGEGRINLISFFNTLGYKTYWLSNQRPISFHDNVISLIASHANYFKFYNHSIEKNAESLDEVMLPKYATILKEPGKKVVVLRLLGTHFNYDKRYPESFEKFKINDSNPKKQNIINSYDNAVLYNDYIVYTLIEELRKVNSKSALLYLSDHGENLYDEGTDFFGRNEERLTKSMFNIPFLVWTSKDFQLPKDFEYVPNRKFMTDHVYESTAHFFGVKHKDMDFSNSIFSKTFKERKRIVVNNIDYDTFFVNSDE